MIQSELVCEIDGMFQYDEGDIGRDLIIDDSNDGEQESLGAHEAHERDVKFSALFRRAEKNKEKLDQQDLDSLDKFESEQAPNWKVLGKSIDNALQLLLRGTLPPPVTRELNQAEKQDFRWRRLVHAALLEDRSFPCCLSKVTFDWRSRNFNRWSEAVQFLMVFNYDGNISRTEQALITGMVQYGDPDQHLRIQTITKMVKDLRKAYDPHWDTNVVSLDQRCIFCVSVNLTPGVNYIAAEEQHDFANDFAAKFNEQGFEIRKCGNFQQRYDLFTELHASGRYTHGLSKTFYGLCSYNLARPPSKYKPMDEVAPSCENLLRGNMRCSGGTEKLMLCGRCKTVSYCSAQCQRQDWKRHKQDCAALTALLKDKAALANFAKGIA